MTFLDPVIFSIHEILKKEQKVTGSKKFIKVKNQFFMPVNHVKEFLKSVHTKAFFPELFSQNFEQLFQNSETFFQNFFWLKSLHMVTTLTGLMSLQIRQP